MFLIVVKNQTMTSNIGYLYYVDWEEIKVVKVDLFINWRYKTQLWVVYDVDSIYSNYFTSIEKLREAKRKATLWLLSDIEECKKEIKIIKKLLKNSFVLL